MDRQRWEYKTARPPRGDTKKEANDPEAMLNDRGDDGWKLVETIEYTGGGTKYLVFVRPNSSDSNDSDSNDSDSNDREVNRRE